MDGFFVAKFKKFANGERKLDTENAAETTEKSVVNPETNEKEVKEKLAEKKKKENMKKKKQKKQKKQEKKKLEKKNQAAAAKNQAAATAASAGPDAPAKKEKVANQ